MHITHLGCCGIKEMSSISYEGRDPKRLMIKFCSGYSPTRATEYANYGSPEYYRQLPLFNGAFMVFSEAGDVRKNKYATRLADFIEKNQLGTVTRINGAVNPNSHRQVRPFMWTLDKKAIIAWADENCDWRIKLKTDKEKLKKTKDGSTLVEVEL